MKKAIMIIAADGFRDEELLQPKEILEGNGVKVEVASTALGEARGTMGARINPGVLISQVRPEDFDALVFVGGRGASQYWDDPVAHNLIRQAYAANKIVSAICIAPVTLARAGILKGKNATVWSTETESLESAGANYTGKPVEKDGNIITGSGPNAAKEFGETILKALK
jgi:protease I